MSKLDDLKEKMFEFENTLLKGILSLNGRSMRKVLREVEAEVLLLALKGVGEKIRAKVFKSLSKDTDRKEKEFAYLGPVRAVDVYEARWRIINAFRNFISQMKEGPVTIIG